MNSFVPLSDREQAILSLMTQNLRLTLEVEQLRQRVSELESQLEFYPTTEE